MLNYPQTGMEFLEPLASSWFDFLVYSMLQCYFMPAYIMSKGSDVDQWVSQFSTNGIKNFNICKQ